MKKRMNPDRKWVYYELTEKGYSFLRSEFWKLIMLVSVAAVAVVGGVWEIAKFAASRHAVRYEIAKAVGADYTHLLAGIILIGVGILLALYILKRSVKTERFH